MSLIGGKYSVHEPGRRSRSGSWHVLSTADGLRYGGLRLDSTDQAALDRLTTASQLTDQLRLPGLVPVLERVVEAGTSWWITPIAGPTLAQALASGTPLTGANAALIATDTGQTLLKLHQAGMAHGDVNPSTILLSSSGAALLAESGLAHALTGSPTGPGFDASAWAQLLRQLAQRIEDADISAALQKAAVRTEATGGSAGLSAALGELGQSLVQRAGFGDRAAFSAFAGAVPEQGSAATTAHDDEATVRAADMVTPPATMPGQPAPAAAPDGATRLGQRAADQQRAAVSSPVAAPIPSQPGAPALRFGQGVPPAPPAWQLAAAAAPARRPKPSIWKRLSAFVSGLITIGLLVVVGLVLWDRFGPSQLVVTRVTVATAESISGKCDVNVDIVGTIETNGKSGAISYEWLLTGDRREGPLSQTVSEGESTTQVHLFWELKGKGTLDVQATLRILSPNGLEGSTQFTYACSS